MLNESKRPRVLIVDDNAANLGVLYRYLDHEGIDCLVSQDGETAVELAAREQPDLILLDIMLPGISGFEACANLKQQDKTQGIPVIFMSALSDTEDKVRGFRAGGVDYVTKPLQQEEVLARIRSHLLIKQQREELTRLNGMKDKFLSIIAHDLRGPFYGFLGAGRIIREAVHDGDSPRLIEIAQSLETSSQRTYRLLEDLLQWAHLQQGTAEFRETSVDPEIVLAEVLQLFYETARSKEVTIRYRVDPECPTVKGDRAMIAGAVRNLTNNAIKFTPSGGSVEISAVPSDKHGVHRTDMDAAYVCFSVVDTGIGMNEEQLEQLFRIDQRTQSQGTDGEKGSGLGLLLVKDFARRHGGTLEVESQEGIGTQFRFIVPCQPRDSG